MANTKQCVEYRNCKRPGLLEHGGRCEYHWRRAVEQANARIGMPTKESIKQILLKEQGFKCAVPNCGTKLLSWTVAHLDHDHKCCPKNRWCIKCVRGLLCGRCNTGIGQLRDSPELLRGAAAYLEAFKKHGKPQAIVHRDARAAAKSRRLAS